METYSDLLADGRLSFVLAHSRLMEPVDIACCRATHDNGNGSAGTHNNKNKSNGTKQQEDPKSMMQHGNVGE